MNKLNKNILKENSFDVELPDDILKSLISNKTSIGNNPAIPDIYDSPFLLKLAEKRYSEVKYALSEIYSINGTIDNNEIRSYLSKLINDCKRLEKPFKNQLEKICLNYVIDMFGIPDETIQLNISLVDKVDTGISSIILDPGENITDFEFDDIESAQNLAGEIYKRRLLDSLCMGESMLLSSDIESYKNEIDKISPKLSDIYKKIITLNNYLLFTKENVGMTDENKMQLGTFELLIGNEDELPRISSQGEIFPVLLNETIRGILELFISHGLPSDSKEANYILGKSDFLKAEPWDMRLGPSLWIILSQSFNDLTLNELPYLLKRISTLELDKFNFLMKEVFAKTKKGKNIMSKLCFKAKNELKYDKFTDKMSKLRTDKSIITDEFIKEEEL